MNQHRFSFRVTALVVLLSLMMGVFAARLYAVQVVEGAEQESALPGSYTYLTRVTAARGEILDRNGVVLVGNRASFNIVLIYPVLFSSSMCLVSHCMERTLILTFAFNTISFSP